MRLWLLCLLCLLSSPNWSCPDCMGLCESPLRIEVRKEGVTFKGLPLKFEAISQKDDFVAMLYEDNLIYDPYDVHFFKDGITIIGDNPLCYGDYNDLCSANCNRFARILRHLANLIPEAGPRTAFMILIDALEEGCLWCCYQGGFIETCVEPLIQYIPGVETDLD